MKDEIKEIFNKYGKEKYNDEYCLEFETYIIELQELKKIYDYITSLQEENKEWKMIFDTFSKRPYAHKYLEEKRKELNNDKIVGLDSEMIYKDYYKLKDKIDKANDYIDKHTIEWKDDKFEDNNIMVKFNEYSNPQELKNILGGDE